MFGLIMGYDLTNDLLFTMVFGSEKSVPALKGLLNVILDWKGTQEIAELTILNPFHLKEDYGDRLSMIDVDARNAEGKRYRIGLLLSPYPNPEEYIQRAIYHASRVSYDYLVPEGNYADAGPVIGISLLNWLIQGQDEIHSICRMMESKTNQELPDFLELHFIQLPRFKPKNGPKNWTPFEIWVYFIRNTDLVARAIKHGMFDKIGEM